MTDWKVKVETQDHQIRTVTVQDFTYPSDASRAALAQSAGTRVISVTPSYHDEDDPRYNYYFDHDYHKSDVSDYSTETRTYYEETKLDWFSYYLIATSIPTLVLYFINPVFAIIFNALFLWWWYKK